MSDEDKRMRPGESEYKFLHRVIAGHCRCEGTPDCPWRKTMFKSLAAVDVEADVCANNHGGNPESETAHDSVVPRKEEMWAKILTYLNNRGPCTCDEYQAATGSITQSASARFSELLRDGKIYRTGEKRKTRNGCMASVVAISETEQ